MTNIALATAVIILFTLGYTFVNFIANELDALHKESYNIHFNK